MATYTTADLRNKVLGRLGVFDPLNEPSAEDAATVEAEIAQKLEALATDGLLPFDIEGDAIPGAYMIPLSFIVAAELVTDYGAQAREASILASAERGMKQLFRLKTPPHHGAPVAADYY